MKKNHFVMGGTLGALVGVMAVYALTLLADSMPLTGQRAVQRDFAVYAPAPPVLTSRDVNLKADIVSIRLPERPTVWDNLRGESMLPAIGAGQIVVTVPPTPDLLVPGRVIVFRAPLPGSVLVLHRIQRVFQDEAGWVYVTRGDNEFDLDLWPLRFGDVVGVVVVELK